MGFGIYTRCHSSLAKNRDRKNLKAFVHAVCLLQPGGLGRRCGTSNAASPGEIPSVGQSGKKTRKVCIFCHLGHF